MNFEDSDTEDEFFDCLEEFEEDGIKLEEDEACEGGAHPSGKADDPSPIARDHQELAANRDVPVASTTDGDASSGTDAQDSRARTADTANEKNCTPRHDKERSAGCVQVEGTADCGDTPRWHLHRLAFEGDITGFREAYEAASAEEQRALDMHGHTVLHLAVLRGREEVVRYLLEQRFPVSTKSGRSWTPLDEALVLRNKPLAVMLLQRENEESEQLAREKRAQLLESLRTIPDCSFELKWEFGSLILGPLLRRMAPTDTYRLWKQGQRIRVDGTLMGVNEKAQGLLPEWKRGQFSVLFDGSTGVTRSLFVNRGKQHFYDLKMTDMEGKRQDLGLDVEMLMADGPKKGKLKSSELRFKPVKTWLGYPLKERQGGWDTVVYQAQARLITQATVKAAADMPASMSWQEYVESVPPDDERFEINLDPLKNGLKDDGMAAPRSSSRSQRLRGRKQEEPGSIHTRSTHSKTHPHHHHHHHQQGRHRHAGPEGVLSHSRGVTKPVHRPQHGAARQLELPDGSQLQGGYYQGPPDDPDNGPSEGGDARAVRSGDSRKARKVSVRLWMATDFPLQLYQLLPLLEVAAHANKQLGKVAGFMRKYGSMQLFPVKMQAPIMLTVHLTLTVLNFSLLQPQQLPSDFFEVPRGWTERKLQDLIHRELQIQDAGTSSSGSADAGAPGRTQAESQMDRIVDLDEVQLVAD